MEYELAAGVRKTDATPQVHARPRARGLRRRRSRRSSPTTACRWSNAAPASCRETCRRTAPTSSRRSTEYKSKPEAASPDQVVTDEKLEAWLAEGADLTQELSNAVLASSQERIKFLVKQGRRHQRARSAGLCAGAHGGAQAPSRAHRAVRRSQGRSQRARRRRHDAAAARGNAQSRAKREDAARSRRRHRGEEQGRLYSAGAGHCRSEVRGGEGACSKREPISTPRPARTR